MREAAMITLVCSIASALPALAQQSFQSCGGLADNTLRLDCYDRAFRESTNAATSEPNTVTTKEIVAPLAPTDFKTVDPADLFVAPGKFIGKPVELRRTHCFYADQNEYRCLAPGFQVVMISSQSVSPPEAKASLENDCGAIRSMMTPRCERSIHFVPTEHQEDAVNAMTPRIIMLTREFVVIQNLNKRK